MTDFSEALIIADPIYSEYSFHFTFKKLCSNENGSDKFADV